MDRFKDASEILEISAGVSVGVEANIRATKLIQVGFGSYSGDWAGLKEGRCASWCEERIEMGLSPFFFHELKRTSDTLVNIGHPAFGESSHDIYMNDLFLLTDRGFFEFGVTANIIGIGIDIACEGAEVVDFLAGWFGADILHDDAYSRSLEALVSQVNSSDPWKRNAAIRALRIRTDQVFGYEMIDAVDDFPEEQIDVWRMWKLWLKSNKEATIRAPSKK